MTIATSAIVETYLRRTPNSARLSAQAKRVFPSGVTHDSRYLEPYPIYVERAAASHKWDADGHEYVDYSGGHGALLLGHNHPQITAAVAEQLQRGTHYGSCHELEIRWGELVQQLVPCAERVRFTSSGTESTLLAIRLARAFTGRTKIVRFLGHFHGWHDHVASGFASRFDGTAATGVLEGVAAEMVFALPNDIDATTRALDSGNVAGVIIEPTGASWGQVPVLPEFLHALRKATAERGIVLIFDEVISGFRCSPGGAQGALGIKPDLTTLAKIVAGGFPGGAVVGQQAIMDLLDFTAAAKSGREKIGHQGTFNANPISAAAGIATLEIVANTDACQRANDYAARLRSALNGVLAEENVPWVVYGTYSGFHVGMNTLAGQPLKLADIEAGKYDYRALKPASRDLVTKLRLGMLIHGVEIFGWPGGPTSAVHTEDDLEQTAAAFRATLGMMREEGLIAG